MDQVLNIAAAVLIAAGLGVFAIAAVGIIKFPDFFTRAHAVGMTDTLGLILVCGGLIVQQAPTLSAVKLVFLLLFLGIANPTVAHAFLRSALLRGRRPWTKDKKERAR